MSKSFERLLRAGAVALVGASIARPRLVVAICALLTAGSVYAAATMLGVETDKDRILSPDLPVQQANDALAKAFPAAQNNLVVMVEADDPADARDAVEELSARLAEQPDRYLEVFLPGDAPYYEEFGLYHLERDELDEVATRIDQAGPLLATLVVRPELPILVGALTHVIERADGLTSLGKDGPRILDEIALAVERFNEGGHAPIPWGDLLFDDLGGDPSNPQLLFVRPAGDLTQLGPVMDAITAIRAMQGDLVPRPGLRVRITGERAVHTEEMSLVIGEAIVAGSISLVLVTLILFVCFRSIRLVVATVTTLIVGLSWTAGLAGLAVGQLNALTSAFAVVYIGLAVDFSIHFGLGYLEQRRLGKDLQPALQATGETAGNALVLCALTTAIGFYAFIPTAYTGVSDMGIISGTGVLFGLLANLTLYPALIALGLGESSRAGRSPLGKLEIRLPSFPLRHPRVTCIAAAALTVASCAALGWVRFDVNPLNVRDPRVESVQALKELLAESEHAAWTMEVLTRDPAEARELELRLEALEGVDHANSPEGFLPDDQAGRLTVFEQMRSDLEIPVELRADEVGEGLDPLTAVEYTIEGYGVALDLDEELREPGDEDAALERAERLRTALFVLHRRLRDEEDPPRVGALEEDLFGELPTLLEDIADRLPARMVSIEDLPDDLLRRYLAADERARVEVFPTARLTEPGEIERFNDLVQAVRSDAGGPAAGIVALSRAVVDSLRQALATAVVVIAVLLMVLLRSLKFTMITLTPLLIGSVATAAVSVVANIPLNLANVIVLPLILGIGVDSGIHLVHRHRMGLLGAGSLLQSSTANAVLFSALTTGVSFATLALSNHLGIASLAQMLTVGIALMLAANVIALPAILTLVGNGAAHPHGSSATQRTP
jgi:hopanoid biosynthesis associated RND transporter like protein HpnN